MRVLVVLVLVALLAPSAPGVAADRPNVVVVLADDMGFGDVGRLEAALDEIRASGRSRP